jgi:hydroxymethylglutaryl-CoA lyase
MALPGKVRVIDVGPRDGLQNEKQAVPTAIKLELIGRLRAAGVKAIETTAFVSPKWVPQMADSSLVMAALKDHGDVACMALTPNMKGLEAALAAGCREVAVFAAASETFSQKNINCSIDESFERFHPVLETALDAGARVRGYVSCVLGCPYEGEIQPKVVADIARRLFEMGCYEVSMGDTIGVGTPGRTQAMFEAAARFVPIDRLAGHFHDSYGMAIANIYASLQMGVAAFDSSVAGLGGCPYAPGASGNVATEDVIYLLNGLGIESGIDLEAIVDTAWWISAHLGRQPASKVARAMTRL